MFHARENGIESLGRSSIRVAAGPTAHVWGSAEAWRYNNSSAFESLCSDLVGADAVVNAAGMADPGCSDFEALYAANAVQPVVVAMATAEAGVRRLVHLSTAAVQGRRDPLDETMILAPGTPYGQSKAEAERALLRPGQRAVPDETVIYRPTSVHGAGRAVTRRLAKWAANAPALPVCGPGDQPVPVSLVQNVAAGVVFAATSPRVERVVVQPSEGLTVRRLLELFRARRIVSLPVLPTGLLLGSLAVVGRASPSFEARLRRLELLLRGQGTAARHLTDAGFQLLAGPDAWDELVSSERGDRAVGAPASGAHS